MNIRSATKTAAALGIAVASFAPMTGTAGATYQFVEDDFIKGGTTQAVFDGSWNGGTSGLVRWWVDDGTNGGIKDVVRGEIKANSLARVRSGSNPKCIAVRVRWQKIVGSVGFSLPASTGASIGVTETSDGYTVSCRANGSNRPPAPVSMNGVASSGRNLVGLRVDICHKATATSMWACATDANTYRHS